MILETLSIGIGVVLGSSLYSEGTIHGRVQVGGEPQVQSVVSVENLGPVSVHEKYLTTVLQHSVDHFSPRVLPVVIGTTVQIASSDGMPCRLYSISESARFNLTRQKQKVKTLTLKKPGVVRIQCEDHPKAQAYIVVKENPYFAVTDERGTFRIVDVPPGAHEVQVWSERGVLDRRTVNVRNGDTSVDFDLPGSIPKPQRRP